MKCTFQQCIDYVDISWRSAARGRQTRSFLALSVNISKTVDTARVTIND